MDHFLKTQFRLKESSNGLKGVGRAFNEKEIFKLHNSGLLKQKNELLNSKILYLIIFSSYVTQIFYF